MLAGEPPFTGPNPQAVLAKRLTEPVPHLRTGRDVPLEVERAVTRALARAPVDRFASAAEFAAALATGQGGTGFSRPRGFRLRQLAIGLGLLLVAAGVFAALRWVRPGGAPVASAAVLPFVDLSSERDQEYFSDGLTEELITTLSQVPGLRVAARTSSFQFKGLNPDVHEVGKKLDVGAVLEGSVRRSGKRLRVSAQLISVKDGYQLWSESYDRDLADVFVVQEDVARAIVAALRLRLAPARDSALGLRPTADLEAYDLYLKGQFAWNQRNAAALPEAVRDLEQATARDPKFARAWSALAQAYLLLVPYSGGSPDATWRKAEAAAHRALALDSSTAAAYAALGYGNMAYGWNWQAAEDNFHRAIAADPNDATAHQWYGDFLAGRGRLEESLAEMGRAHQFDPLSRQIGTEWAWATYLLRRNAEAEARIRQVLALDPNYAQAHVKLGMIELQQHRYIEAAASIKRGIDLGMFYPYAAAALAQAYGGAGDRQAALAVIADLERRSRSEYVPPVHIAMAYGGVGDLAHGMEWMTRAVDLHDIYIPENFFEPLLDPLRKDPRFRPLYQRMGLTAP
jgi:serine/threonine-protein kinase